MENKVHPKMDRENRAKQFMPFDAFKGFREALAKKERQAAAKRELSEERKAELDRSLHMLCKGDLVMAEYFQDGVYMTQTGGITKLDGTGRVLKLERQKLVSANQVIG